MKELPVRRYKIKWIYPCVILLLLSVWFRWVDHGWEKIVDSDGRGYFAYLPAVFTYHDLDFRYFFSGKLDVPTDYTNNFLFIIDGRYVIKYPPGVALMLAPFYLVGMLLTFLFGFDPTGYSFFYQVMVSIAAMFYAILGVKWIIEFLKRMHVEEKLFPWVIVALLFGTNLTIYIVHEPSMSHVYSFAAVAGFLLFVKRFLDGEGNRNLLLASIAFAVILLIRPVNGIAIFGLLFLLNDFAHLKQLVMGFFANRKWMLLSIISFLMIIAIQPIFWYLQNGHWYVWTYLGESFRWDKPEIMKVLFSYRKGWLVYTPYFLLLIPAFIYIFIKRDVMKIMGILFFWFLLIYVISSWWCWYYGGSFGQRAFIEFYPIAVLTLVPLFLKMGNGKSLIWLRVFTVICIFVNLIQSYQYKYHILHYDSMDEKKYWSVFLKTGKEYEWKVFMNPNEVVPDSLDDRVVVKSFTDFESCSSGSDWMPCRSDYSDTAVSGNHIAVFGGIDSYSPMYKKPINSNINHPNVFVRGCLYNSVLDSSTLLVIAVDDSMGNNIFVERKPIIDIWMDPDDDLLPFRKFEHQIQIPIELRNETLVVYLISPNHVIKMDDLLFVLFE